jgi:hypothetical protein
MPMLGVPPHGKACRQTVTIWGMLPQPL